MKYYFYTCGIDHGTFFIAQNSKIDDKCPCGKPMRIEEFKTTSDYTRVLNKFYSGHVRGENSKKKRIREKARKKSPFYITQREFTNTASFLRKREVLLL